MIKMIQKNMNKKGFTLVELIIVIAVMAILAAIVVPRMSGITETFKERADERTCDTIAREIEVMLQLGNAPDPTDGTVVSLLDENTMTPSSEAAAFYYFYEAGTGVVVYAADDAVGTYAAAIAVDISAVRTNIEVID